MKRYLIISLIFLTFCSEKNNDITPNENQSISLISHFNFPKQIKISLITDNLDTILKENIFFDSLAPNIIRISEFRNNNHYAMYDSVLVELEFDNLKLKKASKHIYNSWNYLNGFHDSTETFLFYYTGNRLDSIKPETHRGYQRIIRLHNGMGNDWQIEIASYATGLYGWSINWEKYSIATESSGLCNNIVCLEGYHYTSGGPGGYKDSSYYYPYTEIQYADKNYIQDWPKEFLILTSGLAYQILDYPLFHFNFFSSSVIQRKLGVSMEIFEYQSYNDKLMVLDNHGYFYEFFY